jgi:hypothetical protein
MVNAAVVGNHLNALLDLLLVSSIVNDKSTVIAMPHITGDAVYSGSVLFSMIVYSNELS